MKSLCSSIPKIDQGSINEDAAIATSNRIAVSDGAGGGGIYAEKWSRYLVDKLPETPIRSFAELDQWIDGIWEPFYDECEQLAKQEGGMLLNKFYDEGSFATLVAIWVDNDKAHWIAYGDSVAFCFNTKTGELTHSFTKLQDFNKPPYLINYNIELKEAGFKQGTFDIDSDCRLFCASDTLSHYIIMMYELAHRKRFEAELTDALNAQTRNSTYIEAAETMKIDFSEVISPTFTH